MEAIKGIYHPDKLDAETFIANFTIRLKEFANIINTLKKQKKKPLQHFLITGKRGMGKSTLLRRIFLEVLQKPFSDKLIAVRLGSEQYKLSRLYKLWEEVIKYLSVEEPSLNTKRETLFEDKHYEENIIQIIVDHLAEQNKTLLLLIDNFDQFIDKINLKEQHTLREILMQYPIQIIGNSVFYDEHFYSYDKPFYDFFKPIHLKNLEKTEAGDFIRQLAGNEGIEDFEEILKREEGKIETLRILSGGVPRTLVILLSILSKKSTGDAIDYLNEMLEQVTPLYQDRMKSLSSQQQEIMHHLAIHWDRTPVKELAKEMRLPSKSVSAQLAQLEGSGYINKINTSGRNLLYEIDERFFNIWLLMSEASAYNAKRVIWLTRWLDMFYDSRGLEEYALFCNSDLLKSKRSNRFLIVQALSESEKLHRDVKDKIVYDFAKELSPALHELNDWAAAYENKKMNDVKALEIGLIHWEKGDYTNAEKYFFMAIENGNVNAMSTLGIFYEDIKKDYTNAEKYFLMAAENGNINAMGSLGIFYQDIKKDYSNAEKYFLMAAENGDVSAINTLGYFYWGIKKNYSNAEKYFLAAIKNGNTDAMLGLALLYFSKNDKSNKERALKLISGVNDMEADFSFMDIKILILLWNEKIIEAQVFFDYFLNKYELNNEAFDEISNVLTYFLVFKQKQTLHQLFTRKHQSLKDHYKPIYFALMYEMQTELPDEYLKMPEEIAEPVNDLLVSIKKERNRLSIT